MKSSLGNYTITDISQWNYCKRQNEYTCNSYVKYKSTWYIDIATQIDYTYRKEYFLQLKRDECDRTEANEGNKMHLNRTI